MNTVERQPPTLVLSGKWVVVGMFAFGIVCTATLWIYWQLHTAPFRPLREAILAEYPKSAPRVDGGQRKLQMSKPRILRVVMKVDFNPNAEDADERIDPIVERVADLARQHAALDTFDQFELHLFFEEKEQQLHQRTLTLHVGDPR